MVSIRRKSESFPASRYLSAFVTLPPQALLKSEGIQVIRGFLERFAATGVVCIEESIARWLNNNREAFPCSTAFWVPPNQIIENVISKGKQIEVARKVGLKVLPTYLISKDRQHVNSISDKHFPLCLRPIIPGKIKPSFKVRLIYSAAELKQCIDSLKEMKVPLIAQPFMNLPNLVIHGARTIMGTTIGMQAFLVKRKFEGVTLTIHPTTLDEGLREKCIEFTNKLNVLGNYHFEFLIDQTTNSTYFLELNNRLGGTTAKVYACGYDEPLLSLLAYGIKGQCNWEIKNITVSSKQALLKYLYNTLTNGLTPLDYPMEPKLVRTLNTLLGLLSYRDDVFSFSDMRGSLAIYAGNLKNKLKR